MEASTTNSSIVHYYRKTQAPHSLLHSVKEELKNQGFEDEAVEKLVSVETESCFNVRMDRPLSAEQTSRLEWLLAETFEPEALLLEESHFPETTNNNTDWIAEFGPRMTFTSAFSSNAVSICAACDLPISRLELSRRVRFAIAQPLPAAMSARLKLVLHDRMTEEEYPAKLTSFDSGAQTVGTKLVPVMEQGRAALEEINKEMGLGFDDFDLDYYTALFKVSHCYILASILSKEFCFALCPWHWSSSSHVWLVSTFCLIGEVRPRSYGCRVFRYGSV